MLTQLTVILAAFDAPFEYWVHYRFGVQLVYVLTLLNLADLATTVYALRKYPKLLSEGNPVMKRWLGAVGLEAGAASAKVAAVGALWLYPTFTFVLLILCGFYAWVVVNNVRAIESARAAP